MDTDVRTEAAETSAEALQALEQANIPPPAPVDPAVIERQRAALRLVEALLREPAPQAEVSAWFATRPAQSVLEGLGMNLGEPLADASRPVRLVDIAILDGQRILEAPRRDRLERLATELAVADNPAAIETLAAEAERAAIAIRQARGALPAWRLRVRAVEDEMRTMATKIQAWLAECERARGGNA